MNLCDIFEKYICVGQCGSSAKEQHTNVCKALAEKIIGQSKIVLVLWILN